jgi:predicted nucleic acid-binding Zn ribbon protein
LLRFEGMPMPDEADLGNELMLLQTELAIRENAARSAAAPASSKHCLFCGADLVPGRTGVHSRWCDEDCRDDWEREQRARNRTGTGAQLAESRYGPGPGTGANEEQP